MSASRDAMEQFADTLEDRPKGAHTRMPQATTTRHRRVLVAHVLAVGLACLLAPALALPAATQSADGAHWVATWAVPLVARPETPQRPAAPPPAEAPSGGFRLIPVLNNDIHLNDQTIRQIVRTSVGGEQLRIVVSNVFGTRPLEIGSAAVARRADGPALVPSTVRMLTFSGNDSASVLPGAVLVSDPVALTVAPLADLAIDLYLPGDTATSGSPVSWHNRTDRTSYVSNPGDHSRAAEFPVTAETESGFYLARVEVTAREGTGAVVTIGDSITDGYCSSVDGNSAWPDHLAARFQANDIDLAVINVGIGGNRVLGGRAGQSALARFDRDVLLQTGATHVIVLEGINDISGAPRPGVTAATLIAGHRQLIARARARGLTIYGATLTPYEGTTISGYWTPEGEAIRRELNEWIRTSGEYDAVLEFDAATRDPDRPGWFLPRHDCGDRLHPGDAGYEAMANAVDLDLFR